MGALRISGLFTPHFTPPSPLLIAPFSLLLFTFLALPWYLLKISENAPTGTSLVP
jgi:hypothetical protein